ncbi:MAG: squalene/phytoene synthase family protein [Dokdonella sp.]
MGEHGDTEQALDSFAAKWIAAEPELGIALNFLPMPRRAIEAAFGCLAREIAHAAFSIREGDVAVAKLNWWHEELARMSHGEPRHPLTQVLSGHPAMADLPSSRWQAVIATALQQRERDPAADFSNQIAGFESFYRPLVEIEALLFGPIDCVVASRIAALAHAMREVAAMARVLETGHVAFPLDLLARHQLRRDQLATDGTERRYAAKEQLQAISIALDSIAKAQPTLLLTRYAGVLADRWRAGKAARADDPIAELNRLLLKVPFDATWKSWRAARREVHGATD